MDTNHCTLRIKLRPWYNYHQATLAEEKQSCSKHYFLSLFTGRFLLRAFRQKTNTVGHKRIISHAQNTTAPIWKPEPRSQLFSSVTNSSFTPICLFTLQQVSSIKQVDSLFLCCNAYYCFDGETWGKETTWKTQGVDGRINIKMDLQEVGCEAWTGSSWIRIGTGGGHLWMR